MLARLRHLVRQLWSGLWFVPGMLTVAAILLALMLTHGDGRLFDELGWPSFRKDSSITLLTSMGSAAISVAAVVLSLTMLVLSSASTQFGPRMIPRFMARTGTKLAIGGFVGLFAYQMLVAAALAREQQVPDLAIWVGVAGGLGSFVILLSFLQMVARFIQAPLLIDHLAEVLRDALERFFEDSPGPTADDRPSAPTDAEECFELASEGEGYLEEIDIGALRRWALKHKAVVHSQVCGGDFVARGDLLVKVAKLPRRLADLDELRVAFTLAPQRSTVQDVTYAIRLMVEVAAKALSPGINDFYTAITVVERLSGVLTGFIGQSGPSGVWHDEDKVVRVVLPLPDVADLLDAAFHPLRHNARTSEPVALALMKVYANLAVCDPHLVWQAPLRRHADLLLSDCEHEFSSEADVELLQEMHRRVTGALEG